MKEKLSKIDCVILNYNDYITTLELVEKIKEYSIFNKIIIVDNNSSDCSYTQLKQIENDKIVVVKTEFNGGYGYGNNYGVRLSMDNWNTKNVLIINPDVYFTENLLVKVQQNLIKHNAVVASAIRKTKNGLTQKPYCWKVPSSFNYLIKSFLILNNIINRFRKEGDELKEYVIETECVPGSLLLLDSEKFLEVGGYDEKMFLYGEETLLGYKFKSKGYKTILINEYYYHHHSKTISKFMNLRKRQSQIVKSRKYIINKYLIKNRFMKLLFNAMFSTVVIENFLVLLLYSIFNKNKIINN